MSQRGKRRAWVLGALALAMGCSDQPAPSPPAAPAADEHGDPLPPTAETLVGEVDARGHANVAWVRTLPGEFAPPEVARGPGDELIVQLTAERRPLGTKRFLDDVLLLHLSADTGALRWLRVVEPGAKLALDTRGNIILAWPTRIQKLDADGELLWDRLHGAAQLARWRRRGGAGSKLHGVGRQSEHTRAVRLADEAWISGAAPDRSQPSEGREWTRRGADRAPHA